MGRTSTRLKDMKNIAELPAGIPNGMPEGWVIEDWVIEEQRREEQRRREERPTLHLPLPYETEPPRAAPKDPPTSTVVTFDISTGL